jgi:hypothetical protein
VYILCIQENSTITSMAKIENILVRYMLPAVDDSESELLLIIMMVIYQEQRAKLVPMLAIVQETVPNILLVQIGQKSQEICSPGILLLNLCEGQIPGII